MAEDVNSQMQNLRKQTGRVNWVEYSKLTGAPIPKNAVPTTVKSPESKAHRNAKRFGRVNAAEYKAISAKRRRKAMPRKRVATK
jgi:hypothetical protein